MLTSARPIVERHFAAVRVTVGARTYHLNRARLTDAIHILANPRVSSAAKALRDVHPTLAPRDVYNYLCVAQACIDDNVRP